MSGPFATAIADQAVRADTTPADEMMSSRRARQARGQQQQQQQHQMQNDDDTQRSNNKNSNQPAAAGAENKQQKQQVPQSILRRSTAASESGTGTGTSGEPGGSPALSGAAPPKPAERRVQVPVSHPRYERRTRLNRVMSVTDGYNSGSATDGNGGNGTDNGRSPAEMLSMRCEESLHVRHGPVSHSEQIKYQTYALYKHGSRRIHTQSVGYSSDGDLVLHRRDVAEQHSSDGNSLRHADTAVEAAVCLNPRARPRDPLVDGEEPNARWQKKLNRMAKYPGVRCPKNRKIRNRLINDHFATPATRRMFELAHADSDPDGHYEPAAPAFEPLPQSLQWMANTSEEAQTAQVTRLGLAVDHAGTVGHVKREKPKSLDAAASRFGNLQSRLKSELQHAMSTDFMPGFMADLEDKIETLISDDASCNGDGSAPVFIDVACRDGYGRLITHGLASYYKLASASENAADGTRVTRVSLPRKRVPLPEQRLTSFLRGERPPNATPLVGAQQPPSDAAMSDHEETAVRDVLGRRRRFKRRAMRRVVPPAMVAAE